MPKTKIERKWLLPRFPEALLKNAVKIKEEEIYQIYPLNNSLDFRLRKAGKKFSICIKENGNLARKEWEKPIPKWAYDLFLINNGQNSIKKTRTTYQINGHKLELNVFGGRHQGLIILEVEFKKTLEAKKYVLPAFFGDKAVEITDDSRYYGYYLALCSKAPI